ncbi:MAG: radical SAM protein, partial [Candidatus Margulisiibacteriota bacterium]
MCYAIPGKVVAIDQKFVTLEYYGQQKKALNEFKQLSIGDYAYAQGGYVVEKIPLQEAENILSAWKEIFFELQNLDLELSSKPLREGSGDSKLTKLLDKATQDKELSKEDLLYLFEQNDPTSIELLFKTANFLRHKHLDNSCCVHGIIEISNICARDCAYCGIALSNKELKRYRMTKEEIMASVEEAVNVHGFKALVLQSGEHSGYDNDQLADIVRTIKAKYDILLFVSFGEIGLDGLKKLYEAGARGLLMRFETSNPELYARVHPGCTLESRLEHLRYAYELGYLILTGGLIGLPGQTPQDIIDDLFLTRDLHAEMYSFGPFIPHPKTKLSADKAPDELTVIKVLALARLLDPKQAKILITTGLETISLEARRKGLMAGANSVMLNVTPLYYRGLYSIYPGRAHEKEEIAVQIEETLSLLRSLDRAPTD